MKLLIKNIFMVLTLLASFSTMPAIASAVTDETPTTTSTAAAGKEEACAALEQLDSTKGCGTGESSIGVLIKAVINILSVVVGIAAVIMIIISGFKYITSGGDSSGISSAKTTLVYALVGLAIVASAQLIVRFVFNAVEPRPAAATTISIVTPSQAQRLGFGQ